MTRSKPTPGRTRKRKTSPVPAVPRTCGDEGGRSFEDGRPCERAAGWGTTKRTGPCKDHGPEGVAAWDAAKGAFLASYREGTNAIREACKAAGVSEATVWRWRQVDAAFNEACAAAQTNADAVRVALVEDTVFRRIVSGTASPAETIFFLKNRGSHRWRDKHDHELTGAAGGPLDVTVTRRIVRADADD